MAGAGFKSLTRKHGIKISATFPCSVEDISLAVGEKVGHSGVLSAARMNGAVVIFLDRVDKVNRVVETGITVKDRFVQVLPLTQPATKVVLSNVPPFITDEFLSRELSRHGKVVSPIKKIMSGCKSPLLKHVVSHRRQLYMILNNRNEELNLRFLVKVDDYDYVIFASSAVMKCFGCGEEGHTVKTCPARGDPAPPGPGGSASAEAGTPPAPPPPPERRGAAAWRTVPGASAASDGPLPAGTAASPERPTATPRVFPRRSTAGTDQAQRVVSVNTPGESVNGESVNGESVNGESVGETERDVGEKSKKKSGENVVCGEQVEENTGEGKTDERETGEGKTGEENTGEGKTGERETGEGKIGEENTGEGKTGEGKTGEENTGEGKTGKSEGQTSEGKKQAGEEEKNEQMSDNVNKSELWSEQVEEVEMEEEVVKPKTLKRRKSNRKSGEAKNSKIINEQSESEECVSDSSDILHFSSSQKRKTISSEKLKLFLHQTKNQHGVKVEDYFTDLSLFISSARLHMNQKEESGLTDQEVFRLKKLVLKVKKTTQ